LSWTGAFHGNTTVCDRWLHHDHVRPAVRPPRQPHHEGSIPGPVPPSLGPGVDPAAVHLGCRLPVVEARTTSPPSRCSEADIPRRAGVFLCCTPSPSASASHCSTHSAFSACSFRRSWGPHTEPTSTGRSDNTGARWGERVNLGVSLGAVDGRRREHQRWFLRQLHDDQHLRSSPPPNFPTSAPPRPGVQPRSPNPGRQAPDGF